MEKGLFGVYLQRLFAMLRLMVFFVFLFSLVFACKSKTKSKPLGKYQNLPLTENVDSIVIYKSKRQMKVYNQSALLKTYKVSLGPKPIGAKHFEGDGKTPEGMYHVDGKNPHSQYHKCLGVSYPSERDRIYARKAGKPTGGDIKIHGLPNGKGALSAIFKAEDWTAGCIALDDQEIDELYLHTEVGIWVNILP